MYIVMIKPISNNHKKKNRSVKFPLDVCFNKCEGVNSQITDVSKGVTLFP